MRKTVCILVCCLYLSCQQQPKIPISNNLEIALGDRYDEYIINLNKAYENDSISLSNFLKIDYINDAGGYDHGYVLFLLIKKLGDENFAKILGKMDDKTIKNVYQYIEVGVDASDKNKNDLEKNYPKVIGLLKSK
ncbi:MULTISPECIES: hypothetical protein [Flavobacterium]|uniref:hypothetical protein n=1 Tax=Flavobacterium TaxID=237 RepID=UPI000B29FD5E|nr:MULTISPECIES: hypothetical protein [Flavobacterium]GEM59274.1 hypothetical protein FC1_25120 [Flavobacterium columnare NBRC 100251 = ATCC 23463]